MPSSRPQVLKMDTNEVVQSTSMTQVVYTGSNPENKKVVSYTSKSAVSRPATRGAPSVQIATRLLSLCLLHPLLLPFWCSQV
jgi:hypothetical protein